VQEEVSEESDPLILVVEDDADNRQLLCSLLRKKGYSVVEAENGKDAVAEAARHNPDLVLMDLAMPEMDGVEAVRRIHQIPELAETPILAITGFAIGDVRADALSAGCSEVLEKPIDIDILVKRIKRNLSLSAMPERQRRKLQRVAVTIPVNWGMTRACLNNGTLISLSSKGCLIKTDSPEALSIQIIYLRFQLPDGSQMMLQGRVLYYLKQVIFGVEFSALAEHDRSRLDRCVTHYSRARA
jgi:CheY-like chemotaxis protein